MNVVPDMPKGLNGLEGMVAAQAPATSPYKKYLRLGYIFVVTLFVALFLFGFAKIKSAVIASGTVVVQGKPKLIQHLEGGIIGEILVKNGDPVESGDVLMRLDPTVINANKSIVEARLYEGAARMARLEAERDERDEISWPDILTSNSENPIVETAIKGQSELFTARQFAGRGLVAQLSQRVAQFRDQIRGLEAQVEAGTRQVSLISEELGGLKEALDQGFVSRNRVLTIEREEARLQGVIANSQSEIARIKNAINETQVQIGQLERDRREEVLTELRTVNAEVDELTEQLTTASVQSKRIDLISPSAGLVHDLRITTIGGVIAPGDVLMQIIPNNDRLILEAQVEPQNIDQVYVGQEATIRFSAFNQRTTPELNGRVTLASPDRLIDPATGFPYYVVNLDIPEDERALLDGLVLLPGMPAEVFIQTGERTVWSYIVRPVTDAMRRSLREE